VFNKTRRREQTAWRAATVTSAGRLSESIYLRFQFMNVVQTLQSSS
jgi:hypothetical protein